MSTSVNEQVLRANSVAVQDDRLCLELSDGRRISAPLEWYPRLAYGTPEEIADVEYFDDGVALYWPALDEDIEIAGIIAGQRSLEGPKSLARWKEEMQKRRLRAAASGNQTIEPWGEVLPLPPDYPIDQFVSNDSK